MLITKGGKLRLGSSSKFAETKSADHPPSTGAIVGIVFGSMIRLILITLSYFVSESAETNPRNL
jgi:hypothetical protein